MKTKIVTKNDIDYLVNILNNEGIISFPTETVYGLGIIYDSQVALDKLKAAKERPETKPFTLMVGNSDQIAEFALLDDRSKAVIKHFMPGPVTLLLRKKPEVSDYITNGYQTIGVRMPDDEFVLKLIREAGKPLLVPSANISGQPTGTSSTQVLEQLDGRIDCIVEGLSGSQLPSTIVDLTKEEIEIVRVGSITLEEIREAIE